MAKQEKRCDQCGGNFPAFFGTHCVANFDEKRRKTELLGSYVVRAETAEADAKRLREALTLALRWMGDPTDPLKTFEDIADWFYRDTGYLRPGKSEPLECGDRTEEREAAWKEWTKTMRDHVQAMCRAALGSERQGVATGGKDG